jgi:hypothetical protein
MIKYSFLYEITKWGEGREREREREIEKERGRENVRD